MWGISPKKGSEGGAAWWLVLTAQFCKTLEMGTLCLSSLPSCIQDDITNQLCSSFLLRTHSPLCASPRTGLNCHLTDIQKQRAPGFCSWVQVALQRSRSQFRGRLKPLASCWQKLEHHESQNANLSVLCGFLVYGLRHKPACQHLGSCTSQSSNASRSCLPREPQRTQP